MGKREPGETRDKWKSIENNHDHKGGSTWQYN